VQIRYVNDLGDGTSGYADYGSGIVVTTASGQPLPVTTQSNSTATDAFGRLRTSSPFTLFDSSHRYKDNGLWTTATGTGGTTTFDANAGLVTLNTTTASGSSIVRETAKCFSYQPGKSLLVMSTFVMNAPQTNLRQRVGYYGASNGMFLEQDGTTISFVERSSVTGSTVDTKVAKASWNIDPMDGSGPSGYTLDLTKAQILWMDVEWLGLGTVRIGFIINGEFVHCHSFHHANLVTSTYITTASLPLRYEITNTNTTTATSTLKQICSTVLSEGGYELRGAQQAVGTTITGAYNLTASGTYYPPVAIRLKAANLDAIAIVTAVAIMASGGTANYSWRVNQAATVSGGTWTTAGANSSIEYNLSGVSSSGGRVLAQGYFAGGNNNQVPIDILKEAVFQSQLERDGLTSTPYEISVTVAASSNNQGVYASMDWEEISR
jgi:hypothetical protein